MATAPEPLPALLANAWQLNSPHFAAVARMRLALLWLSSKGGEVLRMQSKQGRVLIEIAGPVNTGAPPEQRVHGGEPYRAIELHGCQVIWRHPEEGTDV